MNHAHVLVVQDDSMVCTLRLARVELTETLRAETDQEAPMNAESV